MTKVNVPQKDGEIVITPGGPREPVTYRVNDGQVTVPAEDLAHFLLHVDGSEVAGDAKAGNPGNKEA
jgi:hypothetical protein